MFCKSKGVGCYFESIQRRLGCFVLLCFFLFFFGEWVNVLVLVWNTWITNKCNKINQQQQKYLIQAQVYGQIYNNVVVLLRASWWCYFLCSMQTSAEVNNDNNNDVVVDADDDDGAFFTNTNELKKIWN